MEMTEDQSLISHDHFYNDSKILSRISRIEIRCDNEAVNNIDHKKFCNIVKSIIVDEYNMRTNILQNLSSHIDKLYHELIIHHKIRSKMMTKLNTHIEDLSNSYNEIIKKYRRITYNISKEEHIILTNSIDMFSSYTKLINSSIKEKILEYFEDFDKDILYLMTFIGSQNIFDVFTLSYGNNFMNKFNINKDVKNLVEETKLNKKNWTLVDLMKKMHNSFALLPIISNNFTPIEIHVKKIENCKNNTILIKKYNHNNDKLNQYSEEKIDEEKIKFKFELLLENSYKITIKFKNMKKCFVIFGYFNYDSINSFVRTSQISNNFVFLKKKLLIDYVTRNTTINSKYKDAYVQNLNLGEILSLKGNDLVEIILDDYETYSRLCNVKFNKILQNFLNSSLYEKYSVLKSLLLGPDSSIRSGAILWSLTKDQYRDHKHHRSCVADILYRNLSYQHQSKLKQTNKYIKMELDKIKKLTTDDMDLKQQCLMNNNMSDYVKKCVLSRLDEMKGNNNEYQKNKIYVETLLNFPWISDNYTDMFTTIGSDMNKCRKKLTQIKNDFDKKVYGQNDFKNVIEELVGKWFTNPNSMGKAIGLLGPPGVGKTLIASGLGQVLGIPYCEFHLGGVDDGSVLNGHSFTYSAAEPGLIVKKMTIAGEPRCILFFDELDKTCSKHGINEVFNVLIHATDPNTNDKFSDKFFGEMEFSLSKCIFVFSFNDAKKIDPILKDRMEIIEVSPYEISDKIIIAKDFLIPEVSESVGIEEGSITMTPQTIEFLISNYTFEAGVRGLKNKIDKLFTKLNLDRIKGKGIFKNNSTFSKKKPIRVSKTVLQKYLGKPRINVEKIHVTDQIGVVNGLYATTIGSGGIIPILVYPAKNNSNRFMIEMTGKMGKVMKESVNYSWIIAKNCIKNHIVNDFYQKNIGGIHIHVPDGATPKDGPSAGSAFTTAFISRITGYSIKKEIAMTGEIGLGGNITAIGGLVHKLTGAKVAGVKLVFVCRQNIDDVKKINEKNPTLFKIRNPNNDKDVQKIIDSSKKIKNQDDFSIQIVDTIYDVIPYCLIDEKYFNTHKIKDKVFNITCDIDDFMIKSENGFNNEFIDNIDENIEILDNLDPDDDSNSDSNSDTS